MPRHGVMPSNDGSEFRPVEKAALPLDPRARAVTRATIAILVVLLAAWVARDFLVALTWGAVLAITAWPFSCRFESLFYGGRAPLLAPLLFTLMTGLVLLVPIVL